jgi:hypothetical protein
MGEFQTRIELVKPENALIVEIKYCEILYEKRKLPNRINEIFQY